MPRSLLLRIMIGLTGAWLGVLLCIALLAAPAAFAVLDRVMAASVVGLLFEREAALSLALCIFLLVCLRRLCETELCSGLQSLATDARVWAVLGVMLCTVVGYYALHPMMETAQAKQGAWSFRALHATSVGFFGLKALLLAFLGWRLTK